MHCGLIVHNLKIATVEVFRLFCANSLAEILFGFISKYFFYFSSVPSVLHALHPFSSVPFIIQAFHQFFKRFIRFSSIPSIFQAFPSRKFFSNLSNLNLVTPIT
jgi:hypothetical protein